MKVLTREEFQSSIWQKLKKHYQDELDKLRAKNDNTLDAEETAKLRGRIAAVKAFLALENEQPVSAPD